MLRPPRDSRINAAADPKTVAQKNAVTMNDGSRTRPIKPIARAIIPTISTDIQLSALSFLAGLAQTALLQLASQKNSYALGSINTRVSSFFNCAARILEAWFRIIQVFRMRSLTPSTMLYAGQHG